MCWSGGKLVEGEDGSIDWTDGIVVSDGEVTVEGADFVSRKSDAGGRGFCDEMDQEKGKMYLKSSSFSGLSKRTTTEGLKEAFSKFGEAVQARVVTDRVSGYSKGFRFVRYATLEDAAKGIEGMDGKFLDGWVIFAEYARPRAPPGPPSENMSSQYGHNMSSPYGRQ
ncbi:organelle RRM domain-containing protein 2, mitochondrial-like [Pistacia vera]|uniref:organelle RRM domain-containing protein 2, mitochondrial-like n=1 Tax=Pistacia vera TaxID=55513 RepID=UPI001262F288|nr:organelle RRM domain-containing protein 2, mitochondrial-like [Pistacia vera]